MRDSDESLIDRMFKRLHVSLDVDCRTDRNVFDVDGPSTLTHVSTA